VADVWVVNASPLISLSRIGEVHLLSALAAEVIIPDGVLGELSKGTVPLGAADLGRHRAVRVEQIHPIVAAWDLGPGEAEVLSYAASSPGFIAIIDDRAARRCASALRVPTRGTLGVILEAKRCGLVSAVAPLIEQLQKAGLFLSDEIVARALRSAGERGP
jgi:predicted nucleic acid-binding protein